MNYERFRTNACVMRILRIYDFNVEGDIIRTYRIPFAQTPPPSDLFLSPKHVGDIGHNKIEYNPIPIVPHT